MRGAGAALVIGDDPEMPFQTREIDGGLDLDPLSPRQPRPARQVLASRAETWKRRIAAWRSEVEVYAYFNNDWEGFAVDNARWLKQRLGDA